LMAAWPVSQEDCLPFPSLPRSPATKTTDPRGWTVQLRVPAVWLWASHSTSLSLV
jgi:hypothetical protein